MIETTRIPNNLMHFILTRLEDIVGKNGTSTILKYAGLKRFIDNYPPNDFSMIESIDNFYSIIHTLMEIYGENGYLALLRGVGTKNFYAMIRELPWFFQVEQNMDNLSPEERFRQMYKIFNEKWNYTVGTAATVEFLDDRIIDTAPECTQCRGLVATKPICINIVDFYKGMAEYVNLTHVKIEGVKCKAIGDDVCQFVTTFL